MSDDYVTPESETSGHGVKITDQRWISCPNGDDHEVELMIWGEGIDLDFRCETCDTSGGIR